jgi:hypothetical protein
LKQPFNSLPRKVVVFVQFEVVVNAAWPAKNQVNFAYKLKNLLEFGNISVFVFSFVVFNGARKKDMAILAA